MGNRKIKILAVDDIPDNLISLEALISDVFPEAETITAQTGVEGLKLAAAENPDIILLDIVMPGMDGYEVCHKLKENEKLADIPVVFLTALKGERESRIRALEVGAEAFLTKPIDETELTVQIRAMIKIRNANLKSRDEKAWLEMLVTSRTKALENELTERKKAELALKKSEAKFRYVFEASNVGKSITGTDGQMFVNQAFCEMLGYTYDEMAHKSWQEITPPEDIDEVNMKIAPLLNGEISTARFTKRYVHKNGSYIITDLSTVIQRDDNNKPVFFITTVVDITEQKNAKEALRQSEEMANALLNGLPESAFLMKPDGTVIAANKTVAERLNTTVDELLDKNIYLLVDADTASTREKFTKQAIRTKKPVQFIDERFGRTIDNRIHPVFDTNGNVESLAIIGIDITDRKKAELEVSHQREMMARTEQVAKVGSWEWVMESDIVYWSDELFRIFGLIPENLAPPFSKQAQLYVEEDFKLLSQVVDKCIRYGTPYELELKIVTKSGEIRYCIARGQAQKNDEGKIIRLAGSLQDINERKMAELAFWESQTNFKALFEKGPIGVAYHRMIYNETGEPINYLFLDANESYQKLTGVNPVGKLVTEAFPGIENDTFNWIGTFGKVAKTGTEIRVQQYLESNKRWYDCVGYQYKPDHFVAAFLEITEQKKAEFALKASEERLALVIEATEQGIWDWNIETNEVYFSKQWKNIIGFNDDELKNEFSTWVDLLHPDEKDSSIMAVESYLTYPKEHFFLEFRFRHKDGSYRWIHNKAASVKNNDGKVIRMFGAHTDITERKKAEKALQHASENWNTTFQAMNSGILLLDANQNIVQSNAAFQQFVGKTNDEIKGQHCFHYVHGTSCPIDGCPFVRMKLSHKRETMELQLKERDFEIIVDPIINENDQLTGAVHILNDITQRKLDEQIQQILFEIARTSVSNNTLEDLLVVVRQELNKVMDTTNFFVALYQPETDTMKNVIFQDEMDNFQEWSATNSLSGQVVKLGETLLLNRQEAKEFAVAHSLTLTGTPSECWLGAPLTVNQQVVGTIVIQSYTTGVIYNQNNARLLEMIANELSLVIERNQMIDDLLKAKDKAEESDKLKSAFLANMSHEIRTPMNGILGFTSLLSEPDLTSEEKDKYIDIIQKSGQRMLNTVNDLIDISKIETGQMPLVSAKTNLSEQLKNLYAFFVVEAKNKGLKFVLNDNILPEDEVIETDVAKLDSIMTNLIKNAIKFTDRGSIEIGGVVKNQCFEFYVRDTGIGIPLHRQKAVFNRFEQADIADSRAYQGSGLGLTIARAYAEMLGGTIELESEPGVGSVFSVSIPVKYGTHNQKAFETSANKTIDNDNRKITILIAEDDPIGMVYLETILAEINCEIISATNGEEAVAQYKKNQDVDIILMDIRMPVMDGYRATQLIRELNSNVFIIAQTAFALAGDREKAIEAGCNDYLTKPVNRKQLMQIISNYAYS